MRDLLHAVRSLARAPSLVTTAVLTLGLGIGGSAVALTLAYSILYRGLPYPQAERLVLVAGTDPEQPGQDEAVSHLDFIDWWRENRVFSSIGAAFPWTGALTVYGNAPEKVACASVSRDFFTVLGAGPALGRPFDAADSRGGGERGVILSHESWRSHLGGRQDAIGRSLVINDDTYRVVAVMPAAFRSPIDSAETCWTVLDDRPVVENRRQRMLAVVGRLRPGIDVPRAQKEMSALADRLHRDHSEAGKGRGVRVRDLRQAEIGSAGPTLVLLVAAATLVLLVVCVNLAHAFLARSLARATEIATRSALGASRRRLAGSFLIESLILAAGGGLAGMVVAWWGLVLARSSGGDWLPRIEDVGFRAATVVCVLVLSLLAGLALGSGPALYLSRPDLQPRTRLACREGRTWTRLRALLVISQVALATLVATGAALLFSSVSRLRAVEPGFQAGGLVKVELELPLSRYPFPRHYPDWPQVANFYARLSAAVGAVPGVKSVALAANHPLEPGPAVFPSADGAATRGVAERDRASLLRITPGYFSTLGQPLVRGRDFSSRDGAGAPPVVIVNQALARHWYPGRDPLGRRLRIEGSWREIVGVAGNVRFMGLDAEVAPAVYTPLQQTPATDVCVLFRARRPSDDFAVAVSRAVWRVDPGLPVTGVDSMQRVIDGQQARPRKALFLLGACAAMAIGIALTGVVNLIGYAISRQRREIGLRLALGARRIDILTLVTARGAAQVLCGLAGGLCVAAAVLRGLSDLLYGVTAQDLESYGLVALFLGGAGTLSCFVAALRTLRIEPAMALKAP